MSKIIAHEEPKIKLGQEHQRNLNLLDLYFHPDKRYPVASLAHQFRMSSSRIYGLIKKYKERYFLLKGGEKE